MTIIPKLISPISLSVVAVVALFAVDSAYDRENLFQTHKMGVSLDAGVRAVVMMNKLQTSPGQLRYEHPACCKVYPFVRGVAPSTGDRRSIASVMADRLSSLLWLDAYLVRVSLTTEGRVIDASVVTTASGTIIDYL